MIVANFEVLTLLCTVLLALDTKRQDQTPEAVWKEKATLIDHKEGVGQVAFSSDQKLLISMSSTSRDPGVRIWDIEKAKAVKKIPQVASCFAIAPGQDLLAMAVVSKDGSACKDILLWDFDKDRAIGVYRGHDEQILQMAFSPDAKKLAVVAMDNPCVKVWDVSNKKHLGDIKAEKRGFTCAAFSPDGKYLALGDEVFGRPNEIVVSDPGDVTIWDIKSLTKVATLKSHSSEVKCVSFSPDGKTLASGSFKTMETDGMPWGEIIIWDLSKKEPIRKWHVYWGAVSTLAFSPTGKSLATGTQGGLIKLWDPKTGDLQCDLQPHSESVNCLRFSPDGKMIASGSADHTIKVWAREQEK
jgi:WD40 repeat protein